MISVIISSGNNELLSRVKLNIAQTIGVPFEIISTANGNGDMGICSVYNESVFKAKYEILCFMHEDLEIKTVGWGLKVVETFVKDNRLGVLGVAGCAYKTYVPSGWDVIGNEGSYRYINYIQSYRQAKRDSQSIVHNPTQTDLAKVACVDGMWFCASKDTAIKFPFDELLLKGFHGYDIDFCLNVGQYLDIKVTFEVLMEHFSEGNFSHQWVGEILKVHSKWRNILPLNVGFGNREELDTFEKRACKNLIKNMIKFNFDRKMILSELFDAQRARKVSMFNFIKLLIRTVC